MRPNYLLCKDERGQVVPFEQDGCQYVDGSLQADLPFRRISTLFQVSHFIVSQVRTTVTDMHASIRTQKTTNICLIFA